ncbi:24080_t:CDS:1, partial [Gigaspora rosea]
MIRKNTITLATLNVQGLNSEQKCQDILDNLSQLLNHYTFDIMLLQETNVKKQNIDYIKESLWKYESEWTSKTAVLAGNMYISFKNFEETEYGCKVNFTYNNWPFQVTNICVPHNLDKGFFDKLTPFKSDDAVNIVAGNFNLVTFYYTEKFDQIMSNFTKTVNIVGKNSFNNFHKKMKDNQTARADSLDFIFVDNDNAPFCREMETHLKIFDQPLVACTLELSAWRLNEQLLEVPSIREEIQQKLTSLNNVTVQKWDNIKMQIQFIFRAHPAHKS